MFNQDWCGQTLADGVGTLCLSYFHSFYIYKKILIRLLRMAVLLVGVVKSSGLVC